MIPTINLSIVLLVERNSTSQFLWLLGEKHYVQSIAVADGLRKISSGRPFRPMYHKEERRKIYIELRQ